MWLYWSSLFQIRRKVHKRAPTPNGIRKSDKKQSAQKWCLSSFTPKRQVHVPKPRLPTKLESLKRRKSHEHCWYPAFQSPSSQVPGIWTQFDLLLSRSSCALTAKKIARGKRIRKIKVRTAATIIFHFLCLECTGSSNVSSKSLLSVPYGRCRKRVERKGNELKALERIGGL